MKYIRRFQREHDLEIDGTVGKYTLRKMRDVFGFKTPQQMGHFLGQVSHETGHFKYGSENLNYSAKQLLVTFSKYFNRESALRYANKPEDIANKVYANRLGNGNSASGDGWKYRGRGAIQLTGKTNYMQFAKFINDREILSNPAIVEKLYYWDVAIWFFDKRGIWEHTEKVNKKNVIAVTKLVNGGLNGLKNRYRLSRHYYGLAKKI